MSFLSFFEKKPHPFTKFCLQASQWSLWIFFFLFPIFFLPWTTDVLEINKQTLFVFFILFSLLFWLGAQIFTKTIYFRYHPVFLLFPLFFLVVLISAIINQTGFLSWVGESLQEYTSVLTVFIGVILFYLILHLAREKYFLKKSFFALFASGIITSFFGICSLLQWQILPFDFAQSITFNTVGTINSLGIFLSFLLVLACGYWATEKKIPRTFLVLSILFSFIVLMLIDFWILWLSVLLGLLGLFLLIFFQAEKLAKNTRRFLLPITVFVLSLFFLVLPSPFQRHFPAEVVPSFGASKEIMQQTWKEYSFLFGSGPGTYVYNYAKFRSNEMNTTPFWDVRFDRSGFHFITLATTLGVLGVGIFVFIFLSFFSLCLKKLRSKETTETSWLAMIFPVWISIVFSSFFYTSNMTLQIIFFLFAGIIGSICVDRTIHHHLKKKRYVHSTAIVLFILVSFGIFVVLFLTGFRYVSEISFAKAVRLERSGASIEEINQKLRKAVFLNQYHDIYYRNLGQGILEEVKEELSLQEKLSEQRGQYLQSLVAAGLNASMRATDLAPENVLNWSVRARIYQQATDIIPEAQSHALSAFEKAWQLEPQNPLYPTEIGKIYFSSAIKKQQDPLKQSTHEEIENDFYQAQMYFEKALALKKDFGQAHYQLVLLFQQQGRIDDAIGKMESLANYHLKDTEIWFQLGLLYLYRNNTEDLDRAQLVFEQTLMLAPTHINALWFLGYVQEQKGNLDSAIKIIERVLELQPENQNVQKKLEQLKQGKITQNQAILLEQEQNLSSSL